MASRTQASTLRAGDAEVNLRNVPVVAVVLIGLALIAIGLAALVATDFAAQQYGVPAMGDTARAYVRATGARDVAIGCWFELLVVLRVRRRVLGGSLLVATIVPVADLFNVLYCDSGASATTLALHGVSIPVMGALGVWLWRQVS
jgi:Domain of unknown function (DUF4267)